jgi:hypothetical protein
MKPFDISISDRFEIEKQIRAIDACNDIDKIKSLTKQLCSALALQKAATKWIISESLGPPIALRNYGNSSNLEVTN